MNPTVTQIGSDLFQVITYQQAQAADGTMVWVVSQNFQTTLENYQNQLSLAQNQVAQDQQSVTDLQYVVDQINSLNQG